MTSISQNKIHKYTSNANLMPQKQRHFKLEFFFPIPMSMLLFSRFLNDDPRHGSAPLVAEATHEEMAESKAPCNSPPLTQESFDVMGVLLQILGQMAKCMHSQSLSNRLTQIDPYHTIYTSYHKSHLIKKKGCLHVSNFWTASMGHSAHSAWRGRFQGIQGPMNLVRFQKNRPIGTRFWGLWKAEQTIAKHTIDQTVDAKIHVSIGFWMQWIIVFMCGQPSKQTLLPDPGL